MKRTRKLSPQANKVLAAMVSRPAEWRHGYELAKTLGIQSGTLYPLLIRFMDEGLLEAVWQPAARQGLPARHAYRLTAAGIRAAHLCVVSSVESSTGLAPA